MVIDSNIDKQPNHIWQYLITIHKTSKVNFCRHYKIIICYLYLKYGKDAVKAPLKQWAKVLKEKLWDPWCSV